MKKRCELLKSHSLHIIRSSPKGTLYSTSTTFNFYTVPPKTPPPSGTFTAAAPRQRPLKPPFWNFYEVFGSFSGFGTFTRHQKRFSGIKIKFAFSTFRKNPPPKLNPHGANRSLRPKPSQIVRTPTLSGLRIVRFFQFSNF